MAAKGGTSWPVARYNTDMSRVTALPPDIESRLASLGDALSPIPSVVFGYLFGSAACGQLRPLSDIDVAVYLDEGVDHIEARLDVIRALTGFLRTDAVDLVVLNAAPTSLLGRVLGSRRIVLDRDPFRRHRFESAELRKFFDFQIRERRLLERLSRGRPDPDPAQAR